MGIKGFSAWLRTTFPHVFCPLPSALVASSPNRPQPLYFDQVFIDLNPFLHLAARQAGSNEEFFKVCRRSLKSALQNMARPTSMVYVSMDGVAPLAKLPEQRSRRQDAAVTSAKKCTFDAQQITPGCLVMPSVEFQVYSLLRELFFNSSNGKISGSQDPKFKAIIDGSGVEGEGEFKIMRKLVHDHIDEDPFKGRVTRAILACDADLFLQALLSDVPHLYLFDPFASHASQAAIFSVDRWRRSLASSHDDPTTARRMALDFVLLTLMSGSDYAPALKYANYKSLWPAYLDFIKQKHETSETEPRDKKPRLESTKDMNLINAEGKSVNLEILKEFFSFYVNNCLPETLKEPLHAYHRELDVSGKNERILNYLELLLWNLDALITCDVTDLTISLLEDKSAPSLIELSNFDVKELESEMRSREENVSKFQEARVKNPGAMALMALDKSTDCAGYVAEPLRGILNRLKEPQTEACSSSSCSDESINLKGLSDSELMSTLSTIIDAIPKESFSMIEKLATFPRDPIILDRSNANEVNFFSAVAAVSELKKVSSNEMIVVGRKCNDLPWLRPYVYSLNEEESWRCPLHRMLFGNQRNK